MRLLDRDALERSSVVANCVMNRERRLAGSNSYQRELGIDILSFLRSHRNDGAAAWADLCCGTGRALIEAASHLSRDGDAARFRIEGIDLAGLFDTNPFPATLTLRAQSLEAWIPHGPYALITIVHGLHYVGDKLGVIEKAAASLAAGGLMVANLDLGSFRDEEGHPMVRRVAAKLRSQGFKYHPRRRLLRCEGPRKPAFDWKYLGADDQAGPNYTGQPGVASYYPV